MAKEPSETGRDRNLVPSLPVSFTVNEQTGWYLDRMIEMGIYGNTRNEAARMALYYHCRDLVAGQHITIAPAPPGSAARPISADTR